MCMYTSVYAVMCSMNTPTSVCIYRDILRCGDRSCAGHERYSSIHVSAYTLEHRSISTYYLYLHTTKV